MEASSQRKEAGASPPQALPAKLIAYLFQLLKSSGFTAVFGGGSYADCNCCRRRSADATKSVFECQLQNGRG